MSYALIPSYVAIAGALFVAELTDKDALLLLALATKTRPLRVFLAGATAFAFTTAVIVTVGSLAVTVVPILWIKLVGAGVMLAYGLWQARGVIAKRLVEEEEEKIHGAKNGLRAFLFMAGALALLDLAGDATEVLTVVFVAQYSNALLVFAGACTGLFAATAVETTLGSRLGRLLTPRRVRYGSMAVFLALGTYILVSTLA